MLASCWSGSSWLSHYHKGLTHHSDDCTFTSGDVGQDQIQTIKKYKYKLQKTQIQTTKKDQMQTTKRQLQTTKKNTKNKNTKK